MVWNPLAALAVIEPEVCVVWSTIVTLSPFGVSNRWVVMLSPEFIRKSRFALGTKCWGLSGLPGAVALPFLVRNAKFTGSVPTVLRQAVLLSAPVFSLSWNVSMFSAAHHCVPVQLLPLGQFTQPGGYNCISS